jgi:dTDP-4-dehydrorhamnose 3,5-epimerase
VKLIATKLPGCYVIQPRVLADTRGCFVKTFQQDCFAEHGLATAFAEMYYSTSNQRVLRGLHFQLPPHAHAKLVYCTAGEVWDVALDLRRGSPTFGKHWSLVLSSTDANMLYLPAGLAHGFYTLSETATMVYCVTTGYSPMHDQGILWDSAGIDWPNQKPVLSERDQEFLTWRDFVSPFVYAPSEWL